MKTSGKTTRFAYNAQAVADDQAGIVVACEVTRQETDNGALVPMVEQARQTLGAAAAQTETLADTGYGSGADLQAATDARMKVLVPPAQGVPPRDNPYAAQHFHYNPIGLTVCCPQGRLLDHEGSTTKHGVRVQRYRCHCRDCPVRAQCTQDPKGRQVEVWPHTAVVQAMREQLNDPKQKQRWQRRGQIIERPVGQIKQHDGFRRWKVWGLEAVRTQWAMICATLNLRVLYKRWRHGQEPQRMEAVRALGATLLDRLKLPGSTQVLVA